MSRWRTANGLPFAVPENSAANRATSPDAYEMCSIALASVNVALRRAFQCGNLFFGELPNDFGRRTQDQRIVGKDLSFGDDGACTDQAIAANDRAIQHDRLNTDQCPLSDRAAMQHRLVADRDALFDCERIVGRLPRFVLAGTLRQWSGDAGGAVGMTQKCASDGKRYCIRMRSWHKQIKSQSE